AQFGNTASGPCRGYHGNARYLLSSDGSTPQQVLRRAASVFRLECVAELGGSNDFRPATQCDTRVGLSQQYFQREGNFSISGSRAGDREAEPFFGSARRGAVPGCTNRAVGRSPIKGARCG